MVTPHHPSSPQHPTLLRLLSSSKLRLKISASFRKHRKGVREVATSPLIDQILDTKPTTSFQHRIITSRASLLDAEQLVNLVGIFTTFEHFLALFHEFLAIGAVDFFLFLRFLNGVAQSIFLLFFLGQI